MSTLARVDCERGTVLFSYTSSVKHSFRLRQGQWINSTSWRNGIKSMEILYGLRGGNVSTFFGGKHQHSLNTSWEGLGGQEMK